MLFFYLQTIPIQQFLLTKNCFNFHKSSRIWAHLGSVGFDIFYSICSLPLAPQVSVCGFHAACHPQFSVFTSLSNCISLRTIMVRGLAFSSLLTHLLRNWNYCSKHEKLAARVTGSPLLSPCSVWLYMDNKGIHFTSFSISNWKFLLLAKSTKNDTKKIFLDN